MLTCAYLWRKSDLTKAASASTINKECTGLIAEDAKGNVYHVANMDQSPENVRRVTLHVQFVSNSACPAGQDCLLFEAVDWYWFTTGLSRVVKKGIASIQENWRTTYTIPATTVINDIVAGVVPQIWVFRQAMLGSGTFSGASSTSGSTTAAAAAVTFASLQQQMMSVRLAAPYYIVMAGTQSGEGAIFARNQTHVEGPGPLMLNSRQGVWGLAQTNYDHWLPDPSTDPRRTAAETSLVAYGKCNPPPSSHRPARSYVSTLHRGWYCLVMHTQSKAIASVLPGLVDYVLLLYFDFDLLLLYTF